MLDVGVIAVRGENETLRANLDECFRPLKHEFVRRDDVDVRPQRVDAESALLAQGHRLRHRADEVDLRRVGRVAGVGEDHLVARFDAREQREQEHVLRPRDEHHLRGIDLGAQHPADEAGHRLARLEDPARGCVVRVAVLHRPDRSLDDVVRRREIGLADFQVHDVLAFGLELACFGEHLKGSLGAQPRHALSKADGGAHRLES